uniref:Uncharacterized protein n=1 Tax=Octopus bimaculoides TaxID=37653 RepID=A0A0L8HJ93_OCTBM
MRRTKSVMYLNYTYNDAMMQLDFPVAGSARSFLGRFAAIFNAWRQDQNFRTNC